jgi:hypothetical protein
MVWLQANLDEGVSVGKGFSQNRAARAIDPTLSLNAWSLEQSRRTE